MPTLTVPKLMAMQPACAFDTANEPCKCHVLSGWLGGMQRCWLWVIDKQAEGMHQPKARTTLIMAPQYQAEDAVPPSASPPSTTMLLPGCGATLTFY